MDSDADLLQAYVETRSEEAFATLVRRHLPLVYGAALRRVDRDVHRAEDVAQLVFTTLARKAPSLQQHPILSGWLHTTCYHLSTRVMRDERLRAMREKAASETNATADPAVDWDRLRPVIDEALLELGEADRNAVLLRFFQSRPFSEIGHQLGLTENAARMRIERTLDALHVALGRRGIRSTGSALGLALASESSVLAAPGLATTIATNAVASAGGISPLGILFTMSKIKIAAAVSVLAVTAIVAFRGGEQRAARQFEIADRIQRAAPPEPALHPAPVPAAPTSLPDREIESPAAPGPEPIVAIAAPASPSPAARVTAAARNKVLYSPVLGRFNLTDAQTDIVVAALGDFSMANANALNASRQGNGPTGNPAYDEEKYRAVLDADRAAPIAAMKSVLGESGYQAWLAYRQSPDVMALNQLMILDTQFANSGTALSDGQRSQLLQLLVSAAVSRPDQDPLLNAAPLDPAANRNAITVTSATIEQATAFLDPDQLRIVAALVKPTRGRAANPQAAGFSADK